MYTISCYFLQRKRQYLPYVNCQYIIYRLFTRRQFLRVHTRQKLKGQGRRRRREQGIRFQTRLSRLTWRRNRRIRMYVHLQIQANERPTHDPNAPFGRFAYFFMCRAAPLRHCIRAHIITFTLYHKRKRKVNEMAIFSLQFFLSEFFTLFENFV